MLQLCVASLFCRKLQSVMVCLMHVPLSTSCCVSLRDFLVLCPLAGDVVAGQPDRASDSGQPCRDQGQVHTGGCGWEAGCRGVAVAEEKHVRGVCTEVPWTCCVHVHVQPTKFVFMALLFVHVHVAFQNRSSLRTVCPRSWMPTRSLSWPRVRWLRAAAMQHWWQQGGCTHPCGPASRTAL